MIFVQFGEKPSFLGFFKKIGKKNTQPKFSEICDFEKNQFFYTQIVCCNFLSYACIGLIFVSYERRRAIFHTIFWEFETFGTVGWNGTKNCFE